MNSFENMMSKMPGGIIMARFDGKQLKKLYSNCVLSPLLGYSDEEEQRINENLLNAILPEGRERFVEQLYDALAKNERLDCSLHVVSKNGALDCVHLFGTLARDEYGDILVYANCVPQPKEFALFAHFSTFSDEGIYAVDAHTKELLYCNSYMERFMRGKCSEGKTCHKLLFGLDDVCPHCSTFKNLVLDVTKEVYVPISNEYYTVKIEKLLWYGKDILVMFVRNINNEVLARKEKEVLYADYMNVVDYSPSGMISFDYDTISESFTMNFVNNSFLKMVKITRKQFDAQYASSFFNGIHPDDVEKEKIGITLLAKEGKPYNGIFRLRCGDGTYIWMKVNGVAIPHGTINTVYVGHLDITEVVEKNFQIEVQSKSLEMALDTAHLHYWEYEISSHTAYFCKKTQDYFKVPPIIKNFPVGWVDNYAYIDDASRKTYLDVFEKIDAGSDYEEFEIKFIVPDTRGTVWGKYRCNIIKDTMGTPVKAICTIENITKSKDMELNFFAVMRQHGIKSWKYDLTTRTVSYETNHATGFSSDADENATSSRLLLPQKVHHDDIDKYRDIYTRLHSGENDVSAVLRVNLQDDRYDYFKISYTVLPDKNQRRIALGSAIDVTAQFLQSQNYEDILSVHRKYHNESTLLKGYCNLRKNFILDLVDFSSLSLKEIFCSERDEFFVRFGKYIVDDTQRKHYLDTYLTAPMLAAYEEGVTTYNNVYDVSFDKGKNHKYVSVKVSVIPNSNNEPFGFLTVDDLTDDVVNNKIVKSVVDQDFDYIGYVNLKTNQLIRIADSKKINYREFEYALYDEQLEKGLLPQVIESERDDCSKSNSIAGIEAGIQANNGIYRTSYTIFDEEQKLEKRKLWTFSYLNDSRNSIVITRSDISITYENDKKQRVCLEEALNVAQHANKAKTDFLSNMSHDIRTPMNAIIGMTKLALADVTDTAQIRDSLETINESSAHLLQIINDILDMSKIESGKFELAHLPFDNAHEYDDVVKFFAPQLEQAGLHFIHSCEYVHPVLLGDVVVLHRILNNIMSNAIKYTPKGGTITYAFRELPYHNPQFALCEITVTDTGIGMDEYTQRNLFEAFNRGSLEKSSAYEGTGLGMSIVKKLVELKGGDIIVKSAKGKGTSVSIVVPVRIPDDVTIMPKAEEFPKIEELADTYHLAGLSILVVDDNKPNQKVAQKMLSNLGATVTLAANGQEAYELFVNTDDNTFDIILMDVQMPIMNGYESTRAIRNSKKNTAKTIPIVAMTANAFVEDIQKSLDAGMVAHLAKPFDIDNLYKIIRSYTNKR